MAGMDNLMSSVLGWWQQNSGTSGRKATQSVSGAYLRGSEASVERMGGDISLLSQSQTIYKDIASIQGELNDLTSNYGMNFGKALKTQKSILDVAHTEGKINKDTYSRQKSILDLITKQYKSKQKMAVVEKIMGKTSANLFKQAGLMGKAGGVGGMAKAGALKAGGVVAGVLHAGYEGLLSTTEWFVGSLQTAFHGGMAGVLKAVTNTLASLVSIISKRLGAIVGTIGSLFVEGYMKKVEIGIAENITGTKVRAMAGLDVGKTGKHEAASYGIYGSIQKLQEWAPAVASVTTELTKKVATQFYTIGQSMGLSGQQTAKYFDQMMVSSSNATEGLKNMAQMMEHSKDMAKQTGISSLQLATWIGDASVQARMLNIDTKAVVGTMRMLADQNKNLQKFGVNIRAQGAAMMKSLTGFANQWDIATHAYAGMRMYAEQYKKDTGKQLTAGRAYLMSRFGEKAGKKITMEKGTLTAKGITPEKALAGENLADKLTMIKRHLVEETKGMDAGEAAIVQERILTDIYKVQDEGARLAIMTTKEGDIKQLADNKHMKNSMMTAQQARTRMLTLAERNFNIQLQIYELLRKFIAVVVHGFIVLGSLLKLLMHVTVAASGVGTITSILAELGVPGLTKHFTEIGEASKDLATNWTALKGKGGELINQTKKVMKSAGVSGAIDEAKKSTGLDTAKDSMKPKKQVRKEHSGGLISGMTPYIGKLGEALAPNEFAFMTKSAASVVPMYDMFNKTGGGYKESTTKSGNIININITMPDASPDVILSKLKSHLSYVYGLG